MRLSRTTEPVVGTHWLQPTLTFTWVSFLSKSFGLTLVSTYGGWVRDASATL